jgi:hypothetical protein
MRRPGAAQRLRAQLPGGSGNGRSILAQLGGPSIIDFPLASRVSCSELLGGTAQWKWADAVKALKASGSD